MSNENQQQQVKEAPKSEGEKKHKHRYRIIKGSGKETGVPMWECILCKERVQAS